MEDYSTEYLALKLSIFEKQAMSEKLLQTIGD